MRIRGKPTEEKPFIWLSAKALIAISDHAEHPPTARSVYLALCEIASIEEAPKFRRTIKRIAGQAGLRYSATQRALKNLAVIGLVETITIEKSSPNRNSGCIFTILSANRPKENKQQDRYQGTNRPLPDTEQSGTDLGRFDTDRETTSKKLSENGESPRKLSPENLEEIARRSAQ